MKKLLFACTLCLALARLAHAQDLNLAETYAYIGQKLGSAAPTYNSQATVSVDAQGRLHYQGLARVEQKAEKETHSNLLHDMENMAFQINLQEVKAAYYTDVVIEANGERHFRHFLVLCAPEEKPMKVQQAHGKRRKAHQQLGIPLSGKTEAVVILNALQHAKKLLAS